MERRNALKFMAMALGGAVGVPESAFARMADPIAPEDLDFFTDEERRMVIELAEAIIPKTDTPGAAEAGVGPWIEVIVKDCYKPGEQKMIREGLPALFERCEADHGKSLGELPAETQVAFLTAYDRELKEADQPFLQQFKELTKFTYVNSEVGATSAFDFVMTPGKWVASMPLEPDMKVPVL